MGYNPMGGYNPYNSYGMYGGYRPYWLISLSSYHLFNIKDS
jgi:hypothetical protein